MEKFSIKRLDFYMVDLKYVKELHKKDKEVFYDECSDDYTKKPYIGILMQAGGYDYFIPLTSAKKKQRIDFSCVTDKKYRALLLKEYYFLKPLMGGICKKAEIIYNEQKKTGIIHPFYCDFSKLEAVCDAYKG